MVTTSSADSVLKMYYLPAVTDQLNKAISPFFAAIRKTSSDVVGKEVRKLVRYGVNGGISAGTETGELPDPGANRYAVFQTTLKNLYGTIEITDKAIRASATQEGAFVSLLDDEMKGLVESANFNFSRMLFGDTSGKLATISEATSTTYTVDSLRNLAEGMIVDVLNGSGVVAGAGRVIEKVDYDTCSVTISGSAISSPAGYTINIQGSKGLELTGLGSIFKQTGTLYGVSRDTHPWLKANVFDSIGEITEAKVQKAIDRVEERAGSKVNFIICSWGVRRALFNALSAMRGAMDPMVLEGGFRALSFNGIPVVADRFCPEGTMYLLNTDDFALHQLCDWQWLEGEDGKILKQTAGKPIYTATLVKYADLVCYRPAGQAMLTGITEA